MALDFTKIKDQPGPAIIFIHDGTKEDELTMQRTAEEVRKLCDQQIIILSAKDSIAISIIDFYDLVGTHFVLIVRDNDQLHAHMANGDNLEAAEKIAHLANQVGESLDIL